MSFGSLRQDLPRWWSRRSRREQSGGVRRRVEIEFGRDIRVRIAVTAPKELASAVIKALAAR